MDELLKALREGDTRIISTLAKELLVDDHNELKRAQVNEFEHYAPCKIYPAQGDLYHFRCFVGVIEYNKAVYSFG